MGSRAKDMIVYLVASAVSANTDAEGRVYPSIAPQGVGYPQVILEIISRSESPTQSSGSALDTFRVQVDIFAKATVASSGFEIAHGIEHALRRTWSRESNAQYDNKIDSLQEVNHQTDFIPDLEVYHIINDYEIRVK